MPEEKKPALPWQIHPSANNRVVFTLSNPFVTLHNLGDARVHRLHGDGKHINPLVLDAAIAKLTKSSFSASMSVAAGACALHSALLVDLYKVTKPGVRSPEPINPEQLMACETGGYDEGAPAELTDFWLSSIGDDEDGDDGEKVVCSNASVEPRDEDDFPLEVEVDDNPGYAFRISVLDQRVMDYDKAVTVLVVQCSRKVSSLDKISQAAAYVSRKYGFKNMEKGRYEPIFLESWGEHGWNYGVFHLFGFVTINNGAVSSVSSKRPRCAFSRMLTKSTENLRKYLGNPEAVYPDGNYIHGLLHVPQGDFHLPRMKTERCGDLPDIELFYESLIRIICGDSALTWSMNDLEQRMKARKAELMEKQEKWRLKRPRTS